MAYYVLKQIQYVYQNKGYIMIESYANWRYHFLIDGQSNVNGVLLFLKLIGILKGFTKSK